jgi:hypothetical protein
VDPHQLQRFNGTDPTTEKAQSIALMPGLVADAAIAMRSNRCHAASATAVVINDADSAHVHP